METKDSIPAVLSDTGSPDADKRVGGGCILVCGQPRSGTTLISSILDTAPDLVQAYELHIRKPSFVVGLDGRYTRNIFKGLGLDPDEYDRLLGETDTGQMNLGSWTGPKEEVSAEPLTGGETGRFAEELRARGLLTAKLMSALAQARGKARWGFKILGDVVYAGHYAGAFPGACFLLVVRDPRDHAVSILRLNAQRAERGQPPFYADAGEVARGWADTNRRGLAELFGQFGVGSDRFIVVRYEDLVRDPSGELDRIGSLLGLDLTEGSTFYRRDRVATHAKRFRHHENILKPINTDSVGRWRSGLSEPEAQTILQVAGEEMRLLGYTEEGVDTGWSFDRVGPDDVAEKCPAAIDRGSGGQA